MKTKIEVTETMLSRWNHIRERAGNKPINKGTADKLLNTIFNQETVYLILDQIDD